MKKNVAFILVFVLLFFSGNPLQEVFGKYTVLVGTGIALILIKFSIRDKKEFYYNFGKIALLILLIFIGQYLILGFVSWNGAFNFILKIFLGAVVVNQLQSHFTAVLFKVVKLLTIISLFGYLFINMLHLPIWGYKIDNTQTNYFFYSVSNAHLMQNDGMFWEPGAFAGILTLTLVLNFTNLDVIWKNDKASIIIILLGILSTQSTTGYITTFVIFVFKFWKVKNKYIAVAVILFSIFVGKYLYENTTFLREKIDNQFAETKFQDKTEYSNTRFGSIIFDWHYIQKHPIIGNGFHESTRYADHIHLQQLTKMGENLGSGNGFSNFLASMGIPFVIGYFALIFVNFKKVRLDYAIIVVLIILLNLQGEQWLNFPIFLSIPFIIHNELSRKKQKMINNSLVKEMKHDAD